MIKLNFCEGCGRYFRLSPSFVKYQGKTWLVEESWEDGSTQHWCWACHDGRWNECWGPYLPGDLLYYKRVGDKFVQVEKYGQLDSPEVLREDEVKIGFEDPRIPAQICCAVCGADTSARLALGAVDLGNAACVSIGYTAVKGSAVFVRQPDGGEKVNFFLCPDCQAKAIPVEEAEWLPGEIIVYSDDDYSVAE